MLGYSGYRPAEELHLTLLNTQLDPAVNEFSEGFVDQKALFDYVNTVGTDEATNGLAAMDIGQFVVWAMTERMIRVHAVTPGTSTDLILARHAAGVHRAKGE